MAAYETSGIHYDTMMKAEAETRYAAESASSPPKRELHLHRNAERLEKRVASLNETASRLSERLGAVLTPQAPQGVSGSSDAQMAVPGCPLALHLNNLETGLASVELVLRDLLDRLDV